jgi:hypothetical protein
MSGHDDRKKSRSDSLFIGGGAGEPAPPAPPPAAGHPRTPSGRLPQRPPSGTPQATGRPSPRRINAANANLETPRNDSARLITIIALSVGAIGLLSLLLLLSSRRTVTIPTPATTTTETTGSPSQTSVAPPPAVRPIVPPPRPSSDSASTVPNLFPNPSLEVLVDGQPPNWKTTTFSGKANFSVSDQGRRGGHALCISSHDGADAAWELPITVKPHTTYLFKGWVRADNLVGNAKGALFFWLGTEYGSEPISGTSGWKQLSFQFNSGDRTSMQLTCLYGGWGRSTGTAWYDDFELIELFSSK